MGADIAARQSRRVGQDPCLSVYQQDLGRPPRALHAVITVPQVSLIHASGRITFTSTHIAAKGNDHSLKGAWHAPGGKVPRGLMLKSTVQGTLMGLMNFRFALTPPLLPSARSATTAPRLNTFSRSPNSLLTELKGSREPLMTCSSKMASRLDAAMPGMQDSPASGAMAVGVKGREGLGMGQGGVSLATRSTEEGVWGGRGSARNARPASDCGEVKEVKG